MQTTSFMILAGFLLAFGLISGRLQKSVVTPPMVFVATGLLFGPIALGIIRIDVESEVIRTIAEVTLVLVLFTDAARIDLRILRKQYRIPIRLLAIGLPLTILLGTLAAVVLFDGLSLWEAAIVAAILAPTDAALGQAVVGSPSVPVRMRQALNVESGLNDGIALPFVMIFLSLAGAAHEQKSAGAFFAYAALQILLGPIVGVAVGWGGGILVALGTRTGWVSPSFQRLSALGLAFLAYAGAEAIGGNGFIAAFAAGLAVGNVAGSVCHCLFEFAEAEGQLLTLVAFLIFGAASVVPAVERFGTGILLFSLLSLTVVRMIPVSISLLGSGLGAASHLFLGWFGPRGLASILYVMLVLEGVPLPGRELIFSIVILTVVLSVFAHGITAYPGARWYAAHTGVMRHRRPDSPELMPASDMRVRLPLPGE